MGAVFYLFWVFECIFGRDCVMYFVLGSASAY